MADRSVTLTGTLSIRPWGEGDHNTLYCDDTIVAEWALDEIGGGNSLQSEVWGDSRNLQVMTQEECDRKTRESKNNRWVSLRYWTADRKATPTEIQQRALECLYGAVDVDWGAAYSEITGYLWTDEKFNVGGHDVIRELKSYDGKYLLMELTIHAGPRPAVGKDGGR